MTRVYGDLVGRLTRVAVLLLSTSCGNVEKQQPTCPDDQVACDGVCVSTLTDVRNCGGCGITCETSVGCFGGGCTTPDALSTPRVGMALVQGSDGLLYAIGGAAHGSFLDSVEAYDFRTNRWSEVGPLSLARGYLGAALRGGDILAIGGAVHDGADQGSPAVEVYDRALDVWSPRADLQQPRSDPTVAVALDGTVFVFWGWKVWDKANGIGIPLVSMESLTDSGTSKLEDAVPASNTPRWGARGITTPDGRIWLIGGCVTVTSKSFGGSPAVDIFDPSTRNWSAGENMQTGHCAGAAALGGDGRIYYAGGYDDSSGLGTSKVEALDPETGTWSYVADLPGPLADSAAVTGPDGRIYVVGGYPVGGDVALGAIFVYDPVRDEWYF
jgi:Kelch motif/Stigma-specific protein, Stig1